MSQKGKEETPISKLHLHDLQITEKFTSFEIRLFGSAEQCRLEMFYSE